MPFKRLARLAGWAVFAIALLSYLLSLAPTVSFWDCGEFIACANELEVSHPPGAPLYLLLGRLFAMLAGNNTAGIALMVNALSAVAAAATAMLICRITIALALRAVGATSTAIQRQAALLAGICAGLACCFSDSFWFNAVEAEVYALSGFFTALNFWLILQWEARADEPDHVRWLLLIAYVTGLSTGVHLLNLLSIPALVLLGYFRKYSFSWQGLAAALGLSALLLVVVQYGILQALPQLAWKMELLFSGAQTREGLLRGGMGLPMGTGVLSLALGILMLLAGGLWLAFQKKKPVLQLSLMALTLLLLGCSSYLLIPLRSRANPPIDMNNPEELPRFISYLKREQYGQRPLLRGPRYNSLPETDHQGERRIIRMDSAAMRYMQLPGVRRYVEDAPIRRPVFPADAKYCFPRMWSPDHYNVEPFGYQEFVQELGYLDPEGNNLSPYDDAPTRREELSFFLTYQLGHMYGRYFMWNFVGRASDLQDDGWASGFEGLLGWHVEAGNKGHNRYYGWPLLLGLMGFFWQAGADRRRAFVVATLFVCTGIAIVVYLNQSPGQPRERDYAYAGSFQTFCIWIGLALMYGVSALQRIAGKYALPVAGVLVLLAPLLMAFQNYDDHSRRGRWVDREFAWNMLQGCAPGAVLFTAGDNDTFPLWYLQEVEGIRCDVRVVNLELLVADWYICQMMQAQNGAAPLPLSFSCADCLGDRDQAFYGEFSREILLPVKPMQLLADGILSPAEAAKADSAMRWSFTPSTQGYMLRRDSVVVDIVRQVAKQGWQRPLYFSASMDPANYLGLGVFLHLEGLSYRLLPFARQQDEAASFFEGDTRNDTLWHNLSQRFIYSGLDNPRIYHDEQIRSGIVANYRKAFFRLAFGYSVAIRQAERRLDSLKNAGASDAQLRAEEEALAALRQRIEAVTDFSAQHLPDAVAPRALSQLFRDAQVYLRAGISNAQADETYRLLEAEVLQRLAQYQEAGVALEPSDPALSGALMVIRHLAMRGDSLRAAEMAGLLRSLTGSEAGFDVMRSAAP